MVFVFASRRLHWHFDSKVGRHFPDSVAQRSMAWSNVSVGKTKNSIQSEVGWRLPIAACEVMCDAVSAIVSTCL